MKLKKFFLYAVYGLVAFTIFMVVLFPKERFAHILCEKINGEFKDGQITMEKVKPIFPPGLKATNASILLNNGNKIKMESISFYPEILSLYKDVKKIRVNGDAYSGKIDGNIEIGDIELTTSLTESQDKQRSSQSNQSTQSEVRKSSQANFQPNKKESLSELSKVKEQNKHNFSLHLVFKNLDIKELKHSIANFDITYAFKLDGNFNYIGNTKNPDISVWKGNGKIILTKCNLKSENIFFKQMGLGTVDFNSVNIDWQKNEEILDIVNFASDGPDMKISLNGNVFLKEPSEYSNIALKGEFLPDSSRISSFARLTSGIATLTSLFSGSSKGGIPFTITGTIDKPIVAPDI